MDVHRAQRNVVGVGVEDIQHGDDREHEGHCRQGRPVENQLTEADQDRDRHDRVKPVHDPPVQQVLHPSQQDGQQDDIQDITDHEEIRSVHDLAVVRNPEAPAGQRQENVDPYNDEKQRTGDNSNEFRLPVLQL